VTCARQKIAVERSGHILIVDEQDVRHASGSRLASLHHMGEGRKPVQRAVR
jgi:hypothetical protein